MLPFYARRHYTKKYIIVHEHSLLRCPSLLLRGSRLVRSRVFHHCIFDRATLSTPAISVTPTYPQTDEQKQYGTRPLVVIGKSKKSIVKIIISCKHIDFFSAEDLFSSTR